MFWTMLYNVRLNSVQCRNSSRWKILVDTTLLGLLRLSNTVTQMNDLIIKMKMDLLLVASLIYPFLINMKWPVNKSIRILQIFLFFQPTIYHSWACTYLKKTMCDYACFFWWYIIWCSYPLLVMSPVLCQSQGCSILISNTDRSISCMLVYPRHVLEEVAVKYGGVQD